MLGPIRTRCTVSTKLCNFKIKSTWLKMVSVPFQCWNTTTHKWNLNPYRFKVEYLVRYILFCFPSKIIFIQIVQYINNWSVSDHWSQISDAAKKFQWAFFVVTYLHSQKSRVIRIYLTSLDFEICLKNSPVTCFHILNSKKLHSISSIITKSESLMLKLVYMKNKRFVEFLVK